MKKEYDEDIIKAIIKKAKGYKAKEVVEEYVVVENGERGGRAKREKPKTVLNKKKITYKDVPPDVAAGKTLFELFEGKNTKDYSDEELKREKERLMEELGREAVLAVKTKIKKEIKTKINDEEEKENNDDN